MLPRTFLLIGLGVLYVFVGTVGEPYCERSGSWGALVAYFAFQVVISTTIIYLSWPDPGMMILIVFPLASQSAMVLPRFWMVIICAAILISVITVQGFLENWPENMWQSSLGLLGGIVFVVLFTQIAAREQKARTEVERLAAELGRVNQKLREYAAQVEELATTQERNRLAREIHDSLGHYLTVINVQLEAAKAVLTHDATRALDALTKAQSLARDGLAEVRRSVATLRSSPLENLSLPEALTALVDECRAAGIAAELIVKNDPRPLAPPTKLTLYRAAQEGLTNVRKHAQATQVNVTLDYNSDQTIRLVIQDNGLGTGKTTDTGFGLLGIRERVHLLDGQVDTHAEPNQGFTLKVEVPG